MLIRITDASGVYDRPEGDPDKVWTPANVRVNLLRSSDNKCGGNLRSLNVLHTEPCSETSEEANDVGDEGSFYLVFKGTSLREYRLTDPPIGEPVVAIFHVKHSIHADQIVIQGPFESAGQTLTVTQDYSELQPFHDMSTSDGRRNVAYYVSFKRTFEPKLSGDDEFLDILILSDNYHLR